MTKPSHDYSQDRVKASREDKSEMTDKELELVTGGNSRGRRGGGGGGTVLGGVLGTVGGILGGLL